MNAVLSGYYQSDVLNSIGDDNCLTTFTASGNCRDSANPASASYAPDSVFSRSYAEIDSFQFWNFSTTFTRDDWGVSLYVKNLFNDEGTTGAFPFLAGGSNTAPSQNYYGNNSRDLHRAAAHVRDGAHLFVLREHDAPRHTPGTTGGSGHRLHRCR